LEGNLSHVVSIRTQIRNVAAVEAACRRLGLPPPAAGTTQLFSGEASGLAVQLPSWTYPAVCDLNTGQVHYDNYEGAWGDQKELGRFLQAYAVEMARLEARKKGYSITEQPLKDGSIKLTIQVTGGAA
jgi:hypothetical protein